MQLIKVKGHEFNSMAVRDSFTRRAQQFHNNIINTLRAIGIPEDDVIIKLEPFAIKRIPAKVVWYIDGHRLHYSYNGCNKYVENLFVVLKVIEFEVKQILANEKSVEQFIFDFSEDKEVDQKRIEARKLLGVDEDSLDFELMTKRYKVLAKEAHPDMPTGDTERFKALNRAHKILKRELA
ncbi:MAG: J domain-containing protein [Nanoarchaeota archaeon]